jgi:putative SOS response-associated peptidase YedK
VIRAEGRTFPSHRCLVPASEFRHRSQDKRYSFSLVNGDWFYFTGIWRPATREWPEAYAILTVDWLDLTHPESELLRPLPAGSIKVSQPRDARRNPCWRSKILIHAFALSPAAEPRSRPTPSAGTPRKRPESESADWVP